MDDDLTLLRSHPPFASLDARELDALRAMTTVAEFADGELVLEEGGAPADALFVVRTGAIDLERDGEALDSLGPGESFGYPSLLSGEHPAYDVRARGVTTCLRIGRAAAERVLGTTAGLRFLAIGLRERAALADRGDPSGLVSRTEAARGADELVAAAAGFPLAMAGLRDEGLEAAAIARTTASVVDAATRRALDFAIAELGEPDVAWAWLVFGSVARREPGLAPDQDHTILWDGGLEHDGHFAAIAGSVTALLARAGFPPCLSGVVATSPDWRGPLHAWTEMLLARTGHRARTAFLLALALDARKVAGPLPVDDALARLRVGVRESDLLLRIARLAVEIRPPIGAFGGLVTERADDGSRMVDLKRGGLLPVTDLARVGALWAGLASVRTAKRIRETGALAYEPEEARSLGEAFDTFLELRLDRQAACVRAGEPVDSRVDPAALDPVSRIRLRQSFRVVAHLQDRVRADIGGGRLG